ncbi:MAG: hypothetical protein ACPGEF_05245 [Endozoicomonas sp.]
MNKLTTTSTSPPATIETNVVDPVMPNKIKTKASLLRSFRIKKKHKDERLNSTADSGYGSERSSVTSAFFQNLMELMPHLKMIKKS